MLAGPAGKLRAMRDVVVVGSLNVDVSLRTPRLPQAGETLRASGLRTISMSF